MSPYTALKIRFGILAARHSLERHRLTEWQIDYVEGCESVGWAIKYSTKAFDREFESASERLLNLKSRTALRAHGKRAAQLRKKWMLNG